MLIISTIPQDLPQCGLANSPPPWAWAGFRDSLRTNRMYQNNAWWPQRPGQRKPYSSCLGLEECSFLMLLLRPFPLGQQLKPFQTMWNETRSHAVRNPDHTERSRVCTFLISHSWTQPSVPPGPVIRYVRSCQMITEPFESHPHPQSPNWSSDVTEHTQVTQPTSIAK